MSTTEHSWSGFHCFVFFLFFFADAKRASRDGACWWRMGDLHGLPAEAWPLQRWRRVGGQTWGQGFSGKSQTTQPELLTWQLHGGWRPFPWQKVDCFLLQAALTWLIFQFVSYTRFAIMQNRTLFTDEAHILPVAVCHKSFPTAFDKLQIICGQTNILCCSHVRLFVTDKKKVRILIMSFRRVKQWWQSKIVLFLLLSYVLHSFLSLKHQ